MRTQRNKAKVMRGKRGELGWTQFELARRVGCSESQIAKIETGRVAPEPWLKEAIAHALNIQSFEVGV
ncbi:MAG: helix-turn-helix domain-containing protein [Limisphaerales bacterium]